MSRYIFLIIVMYTSVNNAQNINDDNIKIQLKGGLNYLFNQEHKSVFDFTGIQSEQPGLNTSFKTFFSLDRQNLISIGVEFIKAKTVAKNNEANIEWLFYGYPISIGYQHNYPKFVKNLYPFTSFDLSYFISREEITQREDSRINSMTDRTENGFGIDGNVGLEYIVTSAFEVLAELKFRYSNASFFTEEMTYTSIEFSGIYFNIGLNYNF